MGKSRLSFRVDEALSQVHPATDYLVIDTDEPLGSWQTIATAYPNVKKIKIAEFDSANGKQVIDADFFNAFPSLECLITDTDEGLDTDFTDVTPSMLHALYSLELERCSNQNISLLGQLPQLKQLDITLDTVDVAFYADANSGLETVKISLSPLCRTLDIDLAATAILSMNIGGHGYGFELPNITEIKTLRLPASLNALQVSISTDNALPADMLATNVQLESLTIEQHGGYLAPSLLANISNITHCKFELKNLSAPVPSALFANIKQMHKLRLQLDSIELEAPLLPLGLPLAELFVYGEQTDLAPLANLHLPKLKQLWMGNINAIGLPEWLAGCQELNDLNIAIGDASALPALPQLKKLTLRGLAGNSLPAAITTHQTLQTLNLLACHKADLGDISQMSSLESIWIEPWEHEYCNLPSLHGLEHLPRLKALRLDITPKHVEPVWLALPPEVEISIHHSHIVSEMAILRDSGLPPTQCLEWLNTLLGINKPGELPEMPAEFHLTLMAAKYNRFKAQHKNWLRQLAESNEELKPLNANSVLFICGRSGIKASEIKSKATELGFSVSKKLDGNVTHVLIGTAPKDISLLDLERHTLIDDTSLQNYFTTQAPKFLQQQGNETMGDSILAMLASPEEATHQVAVQLLEQGGITDELHLPLFLLLKTTADNNLRKQIKQLLAGHGDEAFQLAVNDRILFHSVRGRDDYNNFYGQGQFVEKLKAQRKKWGETLCNAFAKSYFDRYGEGLMYVLMQKKPTPQLLAIWESLIQNGTFDLRRGAGFDTIMQYWHDKEPANYHWHPTHYANRFGKLGAAKFELPAELTGRSDITRLDLGNCLLSDLPKGIEHYRHIRSLSLSGNVFKALPESVAAFSELEELDLSFNHFRHFPEVLFKLTNLKRLDFRRATSPDLNTGYDANYHIVAIPQAFRDAFPECEILQDQ